MIPQNELWAKIIARLGAATMDVPTAYKRHVTTLPWPLLCRRYGCLPYNAVRSSRRGVISLSDTYLFITGRWTAECATACYTHNAPLQGRLRTLSPCVSVSYATVHGGRHLLQSVLLLLLAVTLILSTYKSRVSGGQRPILITALPRQGMEGKPIRKTILKLYVRVKLMLL